MFDPDTMTVKLIAEVLPKDVVVVSVKFTEEPLQIAIIWPALALEPDLTV